MDYAQVEKMVLNRFNTRPNVREKIDFSTPVGQQLLSGIVKTYMYYKQRFPAAIDPSKIDGNERFGRTLKKEMPRDLAELYLDRQLLNFQYLVIDTNTSAKGQFDETKIIINPSRIGGQFKYWDGRISLTDAEKNVLQKKLDEKIYVHELSHCSAKSGVFGYSGFYNTGANGTYCSRLEEIMAEKTALDVVGYKIPTTETYNQDGYRMEVGVYNPESSNALISSFMELAPFAIGERRLTEGRLLNAPELMAELNVELESYASKGQTFAESLQAACKAITDVKPPNLKKLVVWQSKLLQIGNRRIATKEYRNNVSEQEFYADLDSVLRTSDLLVRCYEKDKLLDTKNIVAYNGTMTMFEKIFVELKTKRGMFQNVKDFNELKQQRLAEIVSERKKSLEAPEVQQKKPAGGKKKKFVLDMIEKYRQSESEEDYKKRSDIEFKSAQRIVEIADKGSFTNLPKTQESLLRMLVTAQTISIDGQRNFLDEIIAMPEITDLLLKLKQDTAKIAQMDSAIERKKKTGERLVHRETKLETYNRLLNSSIKNHPEEFATIKGVVDKGEPIQFEEGRDGQRKQMITEMYVLTQGKFSQYSQSQSEKQ